MYELDSPLIFLSDYDNTVILFFQNVGRARSHLKGEAPGSAFVDRCITAQAKAEEPEAWRILSTMVGHMKSLDFPLLDSNIEPLPQAQLPIDAPGLNPAVPERLLRTQRPSPLRESSTYA